MTGRTGNLEKRGSYRPICPVFFISPFSVHRIGHTGVRQFDED